MEKMKRALLALTIATALVGTSQTIMVSANKKITSTATKASYTVSNANLGNAVKSSVGIKETELNVQRKNFDAKVVPVVKANAPKVVAKVSKPVVSKSKTVKSVKKTAVASKAKTSVSTAKKVASTSRTKTRSTASRGGNATAYAAERSREIIDYAKKFMGVPYVFGGASPSGFDCSGFTMYVFNKFDISLPHSASSQAEMGQAVQKSELMPGDLVFFQTYKPGISHVGIYIGGGKFIEASSSRGIAITDLSSSYYAPRYRGATRIIK